LSANILRTKIFIRKYFADKFISIFQIHYQKEFKNPKLLNQKRGQKDKFD